MAAAWIVRLELKRYRHDPEIAASVVFAAAIAGLLGARLLFIFEEWENFRQAPFQFIFSGAGFSWYGGLFAGALAVAWVFKKHKLPVPQAADISAPALALGYGIGRIGCFLAGLGGAIIVPSQSAVLGMGVDALVLAFIVVVIGGLGSLEGALVGALIVGVVRELGIAFFPEIELAVLYLIAAIVLLVRPAGLFGRP